MNDRNDKSKSESDDYDTIMVCDGYDGNVDETQPVKFRGRLVAEASNRHYTGPNQNRFHNWSLYEVPGGYRVYDRYCTAWQGESNHYSVSEVLNRNQIAEDYSVLANTMLELGIWSDEDIAIDLDSER